MTPQRGDLLRGAGLVPALRRAGWLRAVLLALLLVVVAAGVAAAQQPGIFDRATLSYKQASFTWMDRLFPITSRIFAVVSGIGFALAGLKWAVSKDDLDDVTVQFIRRFLWITGWYTIMFTWEMWIPLFVDVFREAGIAASGRATLNPSEIVALGTDLQGAIGISAVDYFVNPIAGFMIQSAGLVVLFAYVVTAVTVSYTLIQSYLSMGAGVLFLGFAGWESTAQLTDNYLNLLSYVGIKLMVLFLLTWTGTEISADMVRSVAGSRWTDLSPAGEVLYSAFLFTGLVMGLPVMFAKHITAGWSLGLANAVRAK